MEKLCSFCKRPVDSDTAAVLTVGGYGNVRYICDECDSALSDATSSKDTAVIYAAMDKIGKCLYRHGIDDDLTLDTVDALMTKAKKRAEMIDDGSYDFSRDESDDGEGYDEIPEELRETEEDKELDRKEAEEKKKKVKRKGSF